MIETIMNSANSPEEIKMESVALAAETSAVNPEVAAFEAETEKPYTFRKLSADDMFLMMTIIKNIGIKEFKQCFEGENLEMLTAAFRSNKAKESAEGEEDKESEETGAIEKAFMAIGVNIGFDAVDVILGNLPKCKREIYQLLSAVSGMKEEEIRADMLLFTEMLMDFIKKPEFPGFIKVVSRSFK